MNVMSLICSINAMALRIVPMTGPVGDGFFKHKSLSDLLIELLEDLEAETFVNGIYESAVACLRVLWTFLLYPLDGGRTPASLIWGMDYAFDNPSGFGQFPKEIIDFAQILAIIMFMWGIAKSNIHFDRPDSWKQILMRILQVVVVLIVIGMSYDIMRWLQELFCRFSQLVRNGNGGADAIQVLIDAINVSVTDTSSEAGELGALLFMLLDICIGIAFGVGIIKKIIDIVRDCVPTIIEIVVYAFFLPIGLAYLASPEGRQKWMMYQNAYLAALGTNVMRILCIVVLGAIASLTIDGIAFFNIADRIYSIPEMESLGIAVILLKQGKGLNILFALGILDALMKKSEHIARAIT